jgi:hypothetical protein
VKVSVWENLLPEEKSARIHEATFVNARNDDVKCRDHYADDATPPFIEHSADLTIRSKREM